MSPEERGLLACLVVLGVCLTIYGLWPAFRAWRAHRAMVREFRLSLRAFGSRHVDVWAKQPGGREPPR